MKKHLVLVGGGHAHMVTLANLSKFIERGHNVQVIGPSKYHYYSGMGPGMLGKLYSPDDIRFATKQVIEKQGGTFIQDKVVRVDPEKKIVYLESGDTVHYDVLSFNAGSYVPASYIRDDGRDIYPVKPIENLIDAQKRILERVSQKNITISIIGGGPSSVEIAGNVWRLVRDYGDHMAHIQIFSGQNFMSRFSDKVKRKVVRSLINRRVEILEQGYVEEIKPGRITLESGQRYETDVIFLATGVKPSPIFKESNLPTGPDGGLLVNTYLQSTKHPDIFGGGDCIYFKDKPLDKVGVYAVRENPVLYNNLMAALDGSSLMRFDPGGGYLLIFNMGDGTGILHKKWVTFEGRLAFKIKDYIDRRFMKKYQSLEQSSR